MRIGILTFHRSINNGAFMQCYALSKKLQVDFPNDTVEVVDYHMPKIAKTYESSLSRYFAGQSLINCAKSAVKLVLDPQYFKRLKLREKSFQNSLQFLPLSKQYIFDDNEDDIIEYINKNYDVLIVGSDAIWNYISRGFPNIYMPDERIKCHKLSYAASCYGMDFLKCESEKEEICKLLNQFEYVGVRDYATEQFLQWSGTTAQAIHNCDPTALLDVDNLPLDINDLRCKLEARGFNFNKPAIGVMGTPKMVEMVRKFYGNTYQIVALYNYTKCADVQLYDLLPLEWAYVFRYFKLVFTTYFHGTMLSLRNGVPLICISLKTDFAKNHTPKTLDVLKRLGYADWYFETDYISQNLKEIKLKADELLSVDKKNDIVNRIDTEANHYKTFYDALLKIKNAID